DTLPWLRDHQFQQQPLVPAAVYVEMALAAAQEALPAGSPVVEELKFAQACFLPDGPERGLRTNLRRDDGTFQIHGRTPATETDWTLHASGVVHSRRPGLSPRPVPLAEIRTRLTEFKDADECYRRMQTLGLDYGPAFRGIMQLWVGDGEALAEIELSPQA